MKRFFKIINAEYRLTPIDILRSLKSLLGLILISLTFSCSQSFPKGHLFDAVIIWKLIRPVTNTTTTTTTTTPTTTVNNNKYIFLTVNNYQGKNIGGISGADTICQTEKTNNYSSLAGAASEYKAFLTTYSGTRRACSTSDCSGGVSENFDWVLKANTDYYRLDGTTDTKIFTTNSSGTINFTGGSTLLTSINSSGSTVWWTGLDIDWVSPMNGDCSAWSSTGFGYKGNGGVTGVTAISNLTSSCISGTIKLLCVRQ